MSETLQTAAAPETGANPLLQPWQTPFETPPFAEIAPEHFLPAFEQAFADHAAEMTVMTLGQTIAREEVEAGCGLMEKILFRGRNLSEKGRSIKRKRPKNAASRDIDCRMFSRTKRDL